MNLNSESNLHIFYRNLHYLIWSYADPIPWVIDKNTESILDLGCGQGNPMKLIKKRAKKIVYSEGVELFKPYIKQCLKEKIFSRVARQDVRNISYPDKSFDVVLLDEIIEHLTKKEAWRLVNKAEKIAKKQIIIATPIGPCYHPAVDGNELQLHKSYFYPEEFKKRGYKITRYGWKWLLDSHSNGLIYGVKYPLLKKFLYLLNFLFTPIYYFLPNTCNYIFIAYKKI